MCSHASTANRVKPKRHVLNTFRLFFFRAGPIHLDKYSILLGFPPFVFKYRSGEASATIVVIGLERHPATHRKLCARHSLTPPGGWLAIAHPQRPAGALFRGAARGARGGWARGCGRRRSAGERRRRGRRRSPSTSTRSTSMRSGRCRRATRDNDTWHALTTATTIHGSSHCSMR